ILYEMVTGEKPFTGQNVTTIIYKIVNEDPIPPRELDVTIHPGLSAVVTKALAKSPDQRYQKGGDLVRDLQNYKAMGTPPEPTSVLAAVPDHPEQKAAAAPAGVGKPAAGAAAPAPTTRPAGAKPAAAAPGKPRNLLLPLSAAALLLVLAIGGLAWYRNRIAAAPQQSTAAMTPATSPSTPPPAPVQATPAPAQSSAADTSPADAADAQPGSAKPVHHSRAAAVIPTASPPAAAATGGLELTSSPAGASVQIDGRSSSTWITPYTATGLAAGAHSISFAKPGYAPVTRSVQVVAGQSTPLEVHLAAVTNALGVTSNPAGAAVWVDGKDTGKVTPTQVAVTPGEHKLVVRKAGFKDATTTVARLSPGDSYHFAPTLEPEEKKSDSGGASGFLHRVFGGIPEGKGALDVKSNPKGAQIEIAGLTDTHATPHKYFLDPGRYQVTLKLDGYRTVKKSVTVEKGKSLEISETLKKQ
ncbi:MAG TPA: PEGA domain-containing protein, partial [Terriglobales bacterium]|nr:PEGA domain-containing protein [Terriglobales bacterium]